MDGELVCFVLYVFHPVPFVTTERMTGREYSVSEIVRFEKHMFVFSPKAKVDPAAKQKLHLVLTWVVFVET